MMIPRRLPKVADRFPGVQGNQQQQRQGQAKRRYSENQLNRKWRLALIKEYGRIWNLSDMKVARLFDEYEARQ